MATSPQSDKAGGSVPSGADRGKSFVQPLQGRGVYPPRGRGATDRVGDPRVALVVDARPMGSWQLRVGAIQLCSTPDLQANLTSCRALIERAAAEGAQLAVLPECFAFLGRGEGDKLPHAESLDRGGPILDTLRELAAR